MELGIFPGVAVISGAGSGMGRETALLFGQAGCELGLLDRDEVGLKETVRLLELPAERVMTIVIDITKEEEARQAIRDVVTRFKRLDYGLNCAGISGKGVGLDPEHVLDWDNTMNINLRAQYVLAQEQIRAMLASKPRPSTLAELSTVPETEKTRRKAFARASKGAIVFWGSYASSHSVPDHVGYNSSKHGIWSLTKTLAIHYGAQGIRVNCLAPGIIDTPMMGQLALDAAVKMLDSPTVPLGRMADPSEVADTALYLCSERASYVNGSLITVDGGWSSHCLTSGVAPVTGSGSGMGRAVALLFGQAGCQLGLLDRDEAGLKETVRLLGLPAERFLTVVVDISDDDAAKRALRDVVARFKRLDYALNCAGVSGKATGLDDQAIKDFDWTMGVNLRAQYVIAQEEIKVMLENEPLESGLAKLATVDGEKTWRTKFAKLSKGSVVMWGSWASTLSVLSAGYNISQHGIWSLTKTLAIHYGGQGIRVNCLAPGIIDTPLLPVNFMGMVKLLDAPTVPQNRLAEAAEVADTALWLFSERASYINGVLLPVDGGWTAH